MVDATESVKHPLVGPLVSASPDPTTIGRERLSVLTDRSK
jgi:hypothetical protein